MEENEVIRGKFIFDEIVNKVIRISIKLMLFCIVLFFVFFILTLKRSDLKSLYLLPAFLMVLAFIFIGCAKIYEKSKKYVELVITDKRVYGINQYGKRVDLPFDLISGIENVADCVSIRSSAGLISFSGLNNYAEIYSAINKELIKRQSKTNIQKETSINTNEVDNITEIKKYKELLDSGIITQEEFDKKKKELLNL